MNHSDFTRFLHSRFAVIIVAALATFAVWHAFVTSDISYFMMSSNIALPSPVTWIADRQISLFVNMGCLCLIAALIVYLNKIFNMLRSMTMLQGTFFLVMSMATPSLAGQFYSGTLLALTITLCTFLLFNAYDNPALNLNVFLVFFLLSAGTAVQYAFAIYIPVMLVGCVQMRIFSLRTLCAALLGLIAPWWIIFGFSIATPEQVHFPTIHNIFENLDLSITVVLLVTIAITIVCGVSSWLLTFMKTMTYNARMRSYNGLIAIMMFFTVIAMAADFTNVVAYVPILNVCVAYQLCHLFAIHRQQKSYIAILSVIAIYILLYFWRILV